LELGTYLHLNISKSWEQEREISIQEQ
jgi:hypothetical protein